MIVLPVLAEHTMMSLAPGLSPGGATQLTQLVPCPRKFVMLNAPTWTFVMSVPSPMIGSTALVSTMIFPPTSGPLEGITSIARFTSPSNAIMQLYA